MTPVELDIAIEIASILLTLFISLRTIPLIRKGKKPMTAALFLFAMVSFTLSLAYWLTYSLIRPEMRMPLAANEIGEIAMFLLFASALDTVFRDSHVPAKREITFTIIFSAASVALWIGWSGEWVQDIICGLAFGYFLCVCVRSLKQTDAFKRREWYALGISYGVLILAQFGTFFAPDGFREVLDWFCYGLMFAVLIWLLIKCIRMERKHEDADECFALAFTTCGFSFSTLYMCSGWFYLAALLLCLVTLPLMLIALRREVMA